LVLSQFDGAIGQLVPMALHYDANAGMVEPARR
jgi:hypothetical protein